MAEYQSWSIMPSDIRYFRAHNETLTSHWRPVSIQNIMRNLNYDVTTFGKESTKETESDYQ